MLLYIKKLTLIIYVWLTEQKYYYHESINVSLYIWQVDSHNFEVTFFMAVTQFVWEKRRFCHGKSYFVYVALYFLK